MRVLTHMKISTFFAASAFSLALAIPAIAQDAMSKDSMSSGSMMKMSAPEMKKMNKCNAMSHDMMMKNAGCMKLMKMHPDMMKSDSMMSGH